MQRADDRFGAATILENDGLTVTADVAEELHVLLAAHQGLAVVETCQHLIITAVRCHQFVADIAWAALKQQFLFEGVNLRVEVPGDRKLRRSLGQRE